MNKHYKFWLEKLVLFIICTSFFSISIFVMRAYIEEEQKKQDDYLKQAKIQIFEKQKVDHTDEKNENNELYSAKDITVFYLPDEYHEKIKQYSDIFVNFFSWKGLSSVFFGFPVEFHEHKPWVRWKMKDGIVKIFGVDGLPINEFLAVSIHEFAHFVDIYFLEKKVLKDVSNEFYDISWEKTKIIKSWEEQKDFVSWYALTNKYEDFAESFTYFILHNADFVEKSKESISLQKKYAFFEKYLFQEGEFSGTDFSEKNKVENYYRDITKIDFSLEKLLRYSEK